ncbi:hypothetical protein RHGRI_020403 [Rhododendron griersonianum]|uniref:Heat stress transcription factor n=1 Tax=Rhododendron griersonianum TaxID=479676 RepID=A0AAV6JKG0_9ERIC|nr:hypothetical protein RHGRI_020403 [Rhododendron griersonianum]
MDTEDGGNPPPPAPAPIPNANAPPPFLAKTYDIVDDQSSDEIVSWSPTNNSFVVWNPPEFARDLLPKHFKHNNFSSFVRQLNTYGFRKVDPDRWEFANEGFLRGQKHLLRTISRRKPTHGPNNQLPEQPLVQNSSIGACVEVGKFGLGEEVERLKRDKNVLMQEIVRLRQQQQATDGHMLAMVQRLQGMEQRQQQMMSFLAKAVNSPGFLAQFVQQQQQQQQQNESNRRIISEGSKKRRIQQEGPADGQIVKYRPLMNEAANAMLSQLIKTDAYKTQLENLNNDSNTFLINDASSPDVLDNGTSSGGTSGVTLQEVPLTSGQSYFPATSRISSQCEMVATTPFSTMSPPVGAQELPSVALLQTNLGVSQLSPLQEMVSESNGDMSGKGNIGPSIDSSSLQENGEMSSEIGDFSIELALSFLDDSLNTFCDDDLFLVQNPQPVETDVVDSTSVEEGNVAKSMENGWNNTPHVDQLTEQMVSLGSDPEKV